MLPMTQKRRKSLVLSSLLLAASISALGCVLEDSGGAGGAKATSEAVASSNNALSCMGPADCPSGFCVDGVCCDSACSGICEACSAVKKGSGIDGLCEPIGIDLDPDGECKTACDGDGACSILGILLGNGSPCSAPSNCASNFCVDGVCCDSSCSGTCQACTTAKKGDGDNGKCGSIAAMTDPDNECVIGDCNGSGACGASPGMSPNGAACSSGNTCSSGNCVDGLCCDTACSAKCQACSAAKKGSGVNGVCGNIAAMTDPDNECPLGNCNGSGACGSSILLGSGAACASAAQCASNYCVDGVCCDNGCSGACNACNVSGQVGTCSEIFPGACAAQCSGEIGLPDTPNLPGGGYMAAGDLNGDGMDDLVTGGTNIYLARGSGFFNPGDSYPMVPYGTKELADLDNDGDLDLIVASGTSTYVMKNIGNGSFTNLASLPLSGTAKDVTTGDLNGDGLVDIATAHGDVSVFLNQGGGTYGSPVIYAGFSTSRISAADMDGDGDRDLVLMGSNKFRILMNPGNGSFTVGTTTVTDMYGNYHDLATADADSDGDIDIMMTDIEYCGVRSKLNPGNGAYPPVTNDLRACTSFKYNHDLFVGDFNGDNKPDYLSPLGDQSNVRLISSGGNGSQSYFAGTNPTTLAGGDFDGDGDKDAAVATNNGIRIMINAGTGTFPGQGPVKLYVGGNGSATLASADVNGDGNEDIIHSTATGISVRIGVGNAIFNAPVDYPTGTGASNIVARDINGDNKPDLAVGHGSGSNVSILINQGNGTYAQKVDYTPGMNPVSLALEDVNGDNLRDLIVGSSNRVTVQLNQGSGTFGNAVNYIMGSHSQVAALDFTGDGLKDLIVAPGANGTNTLGTLINQGNGSFVPGANISVATVPSRVATADLDGNGKIDLALSYVNNSSLGVLLNGGNGTFSIHNVPDVLGYDLSDIAAADLNGDGLVDILGAVSPISGGPQPFVLVNAGTGASYAKELRATTAGCCTFVSNILAADFNGDGYNDFVYHYGGTTYFHLSTCLQ